MNMMDLNVHILMFYIHNDTYIHVINPTFSFSKAYEISEGRGI